jgi:hypothetical protein
VFKTKMSKFMVKSKFPVSVEVLCLMFIYSICNRALLDACMLKNVTHVVSDSENPEAEPVRKITG